MIARYSLRIDFIPKMYEKISEERYTEEIKFK